MAIPDATDWRNMSPLALAELGIQRREAGDLATAEEIFRHVMRTAPDLVYGWQELGVLEAMRGETRAASDLFAQAMRIDPSDFQTCKHLVLHQISQGEFDNAREALRRHEAANPASRAEVAIWRQFMTFLSRYPEPQALALLARLGTARAVLGPELVAMRILDAIAAGAPFALLRLGDGEGAFLSLGAEDETEFAGLYDRNRRTMLNIWFGSDRLHESAAFLAARRKLAKAIQSADVIGIPYALRLRHEYNVGAMNGITSNVNILRWLDQHAAGAGAVYCSQDIHAELQYRGFFKVLLAMPISFGIISCHADIGWRLAETFSARVTQLHIIPEEKGFSAVSAGLQEIAGVSAMTDSHFPIMYNRVLAALAETAGQAQVWLVAAGFLGKLYCQALRDHGAVALDVGSIMDGWAGKITRPYLRNIEDFKV